MAWRVAGLVVEGEIDNTVRERVTGWIRLVGMDEPLRLDLRGDCHPDLAGWRFRVVRTDPEPVGEDVSAIDGLATRQSGNVGDITADQVLKHFECTVDEFLARHRAGEPVPTSWRKALYLEWYSDSNGRVVIQSTRLAVERLGERAFELSKEDIRRKQRQAQQAMDELLGRGFRIESEGDGITIIRSPDPDSDSDAEPYLNSARDLDPNEAAEDSNPLQSYLDQQTRELDRRVRESWEDPAAESEED